MLNVLSDPWITLQIIPDKSLKNKRLDVLIKALSDMYRRRSDRLHFSGLRMEWEVQKRFNFRICMNSEVVSFFVSIPASQRKFIEQRLTTIWERATIKEAEWEPYFNPQETAICTMNLRKHNVFSLESSDQEQTLLQSICNVAPTMTEGEQSMIDVLLEPSSRAEWEFNANDVFKRMKKGDVPTKFEMSVGALATIVGRVISFVINEVLTFSKEIVSQIFSEVTNTRASHTPSSSKKKEGGKHTQQIRHEPSEPLFGDVVEYKQTSPETRQKTQGNPFGTWIRIAAQSPNRSNAEFLCRTLASTFRVTDGDNELQARKVQRIERFLHNINCRRPHTMFGYKSDIMTDKELIRLLQLPEQDLQKEFPQIAQINNRQARNLPASLYRADKGIPFCTVEEKGQKKTLYVPYDDYDLFCKPHIALGMQGCGKTAGQGTNWAVGAIEAGFSVFHVDAADGLGVDETRDAMPDWLPDDHIIELDFGNLKFPPDLGLADVAMENARRAGDDLELERQITSNKLKDAIVYFIRNISSYGTEGFSDRMEEYLGAAGQAVLRDPQNTIMEVAFALTSPEYINKLLEDDDIRDNFQICEVLERLAKTYQSNGDSARGKVDGILSRLNLLLNNQFAARLFFQRGKVDENGEPLINFRKWADGDEHPYYVAIRIPKDDFGPEFVNRITAFILQKWYLAILSRSNVPKEERKPCLLVWDEPHTAIKASGHVLQNMAVELRKYRGKLIFLAHGPQQFGNNWEDLTNGGFTLSLYKTETERTYRELARTIQPFEPDEAYSQLPIRWVAINKVLVKDAPEGVPAFIGQMLPPRPKVKDRTYLRDGCAQRFGTYYKDVDRDIAERRKAIMPADREELSARTMAAPMNRVGGTANLNRR